jgi:predicted cupin superfamily sugar epimerase
MTAKKIIQKLNLKQHPEGGYYGETYRSTQLVTHKNGASRSISTAIYFLLEGNNKSHFHRIQSDELWFFHQGAPLEIIFIENSQIHTTIVGNDIDDGQTPQICIPANTWFGAKVTDEKDYSLVSCTVAPGFDFLDFELAERNALLHEFPHLQDIILELTV